MSLINCDEQPIGKLCLKAEEFQILLDRIMDDLLDRDIQSITISRHRRRIVYKIEGRYLTLRLTEGANVYEITGEKKDWINILSANFDTNHPYRHYL